METITVILNQNTVNLNNRIYEETKLMKNSLNVSFSHPSNESLIMKTLLKRNGINIGDTVVYSPNNKDTDSYTVNKFSITGKHAVIIDKEGLKKICGVDDLNIVSKWSEIDKIFGEDIPEVEDDSFIPEINLNPHILRIV